MFGLIYGVYKLNEWNEQRIARKFIQSQEQIITVNEFKIDTLNKRNKLLEFKIDTLHRKLDSLSKVKTKIYWKNANNIKVIYDASIAEHAAWLDSIITEVDY